MAHVQAKVWLGCTASKYLNDLGNCGSAIIVPTSWLYWSRLCGQSFDGHFAEQGCKGCTASSATCASTTESSFLLRTAAGGQHGPHLRKDKHLDAAFGKDVSANR